MSKIYKLKKNAAAKAQIQQQQDSNWFDEIRKIDLTKPHSMNELRIKYGLKPLNAPGYNEKLIPFNKA